MKILPIGNVVRLNEGQVKLMILNERLYIIKMVLLVILITQLVFIQLV